MKKSMLMGALCLTMGAGLLASPPSTGMTTDETEIYSDSHSIVASNSWHPDQVKGMGDIDFDGHDDFLRYRQQAPLSEVVELVSGADGQVLQSAAVNYGPFIASSGIREYGNAGDYDFDFIDDFFIVRRDFSATQNPYFLIEIYSSSTGAPLTSASISTPVTVNADHDFNGDGVNDYLIQDYDSVTFSLIDGVSLLTVSSFTIPGTWPNIYIVGVVDDRDSDGLKDFIVHDRLTGSNALYSFLTQSTIPGYLPSGQGDWRVYEDLDGDGLEELFRALPGQFHYKHRPMYTSFEVRSSQPGLTPIFSRSAPAGDWFVGINFVNDLAQDGDSIKDLAVTQHTGGGPNPFGPGSLKTYSSVDGSLMSSTSIASSLIPPSVFYGPMPFVNDVGDVNGDGSPDLSFSGAIDTVNSVVDQFVLSTTVLSLTSRKHEVSAAAGGLVEFHINAGVANANKFALILGTTSGTDIGIDVGGVHVPLNFDAYTIATYENASATGANGFTTLVQLDGCGQATASINIAGGLPAAAVGLRFHHAAVFFDPVQNVVTGASNPVVLTIN